MKKTCYLHLGFHKTATTSFQLTIQNNSKLLEQEGIFLPKFRGKKQKYSTNHSGQIRDIFDEKHEYLWDSNNSSKQPNDSRQQTIQGHCQSLAQLLNLEHDILISGEGLSTMPQQSLLRLKDKFESHGFQIEPFALVRAPYAYLTSALQQTIKNGKHHPLISLTHHHVGASDTSFKIPNSSKSISSLKRVFGEKMNFVPFTTAINHPGGPVLYLLQEVLQLKHADQHQLINANESKSNLSTRLNNFLNQQNSDSNQVDINKLLKSIPLQDRQDKFLLTEQEFSCIETQFKQVKREMRRKLGKQFVQEKIAFAPEFSAEETQHILSKLPKGV